MCTLYAHREMSQSYFSHILVIYICRGTISLSVTLAELYRPFRVRRSLSPGIIPYPLAPRQIRFKKTHTRIIALECSPSPDTTSPSFAPPSSCLLFILHPFDSPACLQFDFSAASIMFGQCGGPVWRGDDFSACFQREFVVQCFG